MPRPTPISVAERAERRRLFIAAPRGTWSAPGEQALAGGVYVTDAQGNRECLGSLFYGENAARLAAVAVNVLPRLFCDLDKARRQLDDAQSDALVKRLLGPIPVMGTVG